VPLGVDNCAIEWDVPNFVCVINSDYGAINAADRLQFAMEIFEKCAVSSPVWEKKNHKGSNLVGDHIQGIVVRPLDLLFSHFPHKIYGQWRRQGSIWGPTPTPKQDIP